MGEKRNVKKNNEKKNKFASTLDEHRCTMHEKLGFRGLLKVHEENKGWKVAEQTEEKTKNKTI